MSLKEACRDGNETTDQTTHGAEQAPNKTAEIERVEQVGKRAEVDVDAVAVEDGKVEDLSAVGDGDAQVVALVDELLAIVDGAGWRSKVATDVDAVVVQRGNVEKLGAVQDGEADVRALVDERAGSRGGSSGSR